MIVYEVASVEREAMLSGAAGMASATVEIDCWSNTFADAVALNEQVRLALHGFKGWMGRADQTTKIRGMFVHPGQVADIIKRFPEVTRARLVVTGEMANDAMTLKVETSGAAPEALAGKIGDAIRDVTKLRGAVEILGVGSLPNDGRVIEDARSYK